MDRIPKAETDHILNLCFHKSDLVEKTIQTNHCVAIYISQVYKLQLFKRGIVHYISFSESKNKYIALKIQNNILGVIFRLGLCMASKEFTNKPNK